MGDQDKIAELLERSDVHGLLVILASLDAAERSERIRRAVFHATDRGAVCTACGSSDLRVQSTWRVEPWRRQYLKCQACGANSKRLVPLEPTPTEDKQSGESGEREA